MNTEGEAIHFPSADSMLQGRLFRAAKQPAPTAILAHGFPGGEGDVLGLGGALSTVGWNAVSFNYRGVWGSEGQHTLENAVEDLSAAVRFLRGRKDLVDRSMTISLVGWSLGGWVALMAAARDHSIDCVVSVAAANMGEIAKQVVADRAVRQAIEQHVKETMTGTPARSPGVEAMLTELLARSADYDLLAHVEALSNKRLLIVGGWRDEEATMERFVLPLVRALQAAGADRMTPVTLNDGHDFAQTRDELHHIVTDWLTHAWQTTSIMRS